MKKTIIHIIYNLGRGGAETMLVTEIKELTDYNNIVVTLFPQNHFKDELKADKYYCLSLKALAWLPFAIPQLKKIIKENNADIIHTHLFWPTVLARLSTPKKIPLITTIHAFIATSIEYKKWYIRFLDRLTYNFHKNIIITVAKGALDEYFSFLKIKKYKAYALHTFVDTKIFIKKNRLQTQTDPDIFKLITVGALRLQKNQMYLLKAFKLIDNKKFQLDIYGGGPLRKEMETFIKENNLNIHLKGEVKNIQNILPEYDLYVMSSSYEGFSLSVLEAMAMDIPLLLSDIRSFREQCDNTARYFEINNPKTFVEKLQSLADDRIGLQKMADNAYERAITNFTLEQHMQGLRRIYSEVLCDS